MWACIKCVFSGRGKLDGMAVAKGQGPEIHLHCLNCVFTRCASKEGCPFVICLECQTPLHACKLDDHLAHICQNHMVPCCNEAYGCKVVLKRYKRASHLLHCPASIVQCRFAYQRLQHPHFGRKKSEDPRFSECVSVHEELLLNDLKFIANSDAAISEVAKKFETHFDKNLVDVDVSRVHSCLNQFRYLGDEFSKGKRSYELLAFSSYDYGTYRKIPSHSFTCGLFVQRKHFADHTKKHHDFCIDLHFITPRCPLNYYGCTFTSLEFEPASKGYLLEFKRDLNSFVVSSVSNCTPDAKGKDFLSSIPIEILVYLISFLDGFELWNLSQTSWYLRNICKNSLNEKGIVYFCWEKINGNWTTKSLVSVVDLLVMILIINNY